METLINIGNDKLSTPIGELIKPIETREIFSKIPEHELTPEEQTREWALKKQDEGLKRIEKIFEVLKIKRTELENDGKIPQIFLIKKNTLAEKCHLKDDSPHKEGFLNQDVLAIVDKKNSNRLNLIHSFSLRGESDYSFSYLDKYGEKAAGCFNPNKPIRNFSDKKDRKGNPLYIDLNAIKNADDLKELLVNRTEIHNLNINYLEIFNSQKKPRSGKNVYENQISIEEWERDFKIREILMATNPEIIAHTNNIIDGLTKSEIEEIEKSHVLPVQKEWLHPRNVVEMSSDNLNSARDQIKLLVDKGFIDLDINNIDDDDKLINQLVCFQSGTPFHNFKIGPAFLHGNILAIPIKTSNFCDQSSRDFLYVGNIDIKNSFRKSKNSNIYGVPYMNKQFRTMTIGLQIHVEDYRAIEVIKADTDYDRSLIRYRQN